MSFTAFFTVLMGLAAAVAAAPVAADPVTVDGVNTTALPDPMCGYKFHITSPYFAIYMPNTTMPSDQGTGTWGGGLIDNLRGKETAIADECNPLNWQATIDDAQRGLACVFNVQVGCSATDVSRALHAASDTGVICADDLGADLDSFVAAGESVISILAPFISARE